MDLYTAVIEKRAFNISSRAKHIGGGALIGGALGGGLGYISPSEADVKKDPNIRTKSMIGNGVLSGILGGALGNDVHNLKRYAGGSYGGGGGYSAHDSAHAGGGGSSHWAGDAAKTKARAAAASAFDPTHHGKGVGRMWETILDSTELHDPAKQAAAVEFMKSVGRPGANMDALRQHMQHFPQDTLTGQMMTVLFNKHHGSKVASLQAHQKLAAWDVYASYGVW